MGGSAGQVLRGRKPSHSNEKGGQMSDPTPTPTGGSGNVSLYAGSWQEGYIAGSRRARDLGTEDVRNPVTGVQELKPHPPPPLNKGDAEAAADEYMRKVHGRYRDAYRDGYSQGFTDASKDLEEDAEKWKKP